MILKPLLFCLILLITFSIKLASQSLDAEILRYTTLCDVDKEKLTITDSITIQINNRAGDKYTNISIPYSKLEKVSAIEAWIEESNGNVVRNLKKSDISDRSAVSENSLYEDDFIKCFQLKHNIYPYKVTYTYQTICKNYIIISSWTPVIYDKIPTRNARLKIQFPKGFEYSKYSTNTSDFRKDSTEANIILEWAASYPNPIEPEIFSQPNDFKPSVLVTPVYFKYGVEGSSKDWISYGNWQYKLLQNLDVLPEEEKKTISELVKGITDKREIIKTLYHYLQDNTRYINISIGIGGLKPYPASYVALNKYGDCKALTNYMKAILNYVGIESFYTKVKASEQPQNILKSIAGPQFNHVVLAIPLMNDTIWLENTDNANPFDYMGSFTQNRDAFLVSKDKSKFVRIPALKSKDNQSSFKLDFDLSTTESSNVTIHSTFRGSGFEVFNQLHNEYNDDEKDKIFRSYLPFDNYEVIKWELVRENRDTAKIGLNVNLNLSKFLKPLGSDYYLTLFPCRIPLFTVPSNRKLPVILPFPICNSDTLMYNIPVDYELKNKPDTFSLKTKYGNYELQLNIINGKIYAIKHFELYSASYSIAEYPDFYSFIKSVNEIDRMNLVLKRQL
ncbi:hypothetical protein AQPE_1267 [Aquipluma nitroreducens]|uniref:DUF3857 domain-containing protein n=1 Tax=Aquipluma nitroreducens TaxID=2010828 RepID=A0A5K7S6E4_9BACT|nr:hypothetical protein AQPE_1267 [Aquipluma nitroreducens]